MIFSRTPDLIVLDLMLPGGWLGGLPTGAQGHVCHHASRRTEILTKSWAWAWGGDYLTKPFNPRELVARIKAVLRQRVGRAGGGQGLVSGFRSGLSGARGPSGQ